jgi:hypothetical protein
VEKSEWCVREDVSHFPVLVPGFIDTQR